jgi:hypothetical protein
VGGHNGNYDTERVVKVDVCIRGCIHDFLGCAGNCYTTGKTCEYEFSCRVKCG